jgi:succinyl-CoA:acetate CoA-transferase
MGNMENNFERIRNKQLLDRVVSPEEAASWIKDGMTIGLSGFAVGGTAKAIPTALAKRAETEKFKVNVFTGASLGSDIEGILADSGIVHKRVPYQTNKSMRKRINDADVLFYDQHLSHVADWVRTGVYGQIDYAIVEAVAITEDGMVIPTGSVGNSPVFMRCAKHVIVEINTDIPQSLEGVHDVYEPAQQGQRGPIPITKVSDRIGTIGIQVEPEKIKGIVFTHQKDAGAAIVSPDEETKTMASHLLNFLREEIKAGRLPEQLPPLQSGVGSIANAVLHGLLDSEFKDLVLYSEVLQDAVFDMIDAGKVKVASSCSLTLSDEKREHVYANFDKYHDHLVLRPQEISNNPEVIRRLGLISFNTALELDIYGNVNSTHVLGTKMMNGIGGSGDFARNARLAIFVTKSIAKNGDISSIVPFASHIDHTEHDVDVIVTEQGYADLRGLAPRERAEQIIENCAHPLYKKQLWDYYTEALSRGGQTPHIIEKAFSWHENFMKNKTMLQKESQEAKN